MTVDDFRVLYHTEPFVPFTIYLDDGREIFVAQRFHIALDPNNRSIAVALPDETMDLVDIRRVERVELNGSDTNSSQNDK